MTLSLVFLFLLIACKSQNNCIKWLESIADSFPHLAVHNAYHLRSTNMININDEYKANVSIPRFAYNNPSITELLSNGVVGLEIDINPQNELSGTDDFPVYHIKTYDELSSCHTFRECLNEINDWYILNNYTISSGPLLIFIEVKDPDKYSEDEYKLINSIWTEVFDENALYTPSVHNNGNDLLLQYNDWSDVCYDDVKNMIIPHVLYKYTKYINNDILSNLNMFPMCDCQTYATYCIVLRDKCDDDTLGINATNRLKYLYRSHTPSTQQYPQWHEYPLIYNESKPYGQQLLGFEVNDELINEIHARFSKYIDDVINPLTADQWQYWQTVAYIDSINNKNGKWEKSDLLKFFKILSPNQSMLSFVLDVLFWKEGFEGWHILDPLLWAKIQCLWVHGDYGLDELNININLSHALIGICQQIDKGFHYLFSDYPYNWTYFQDFTMREIERRNMCENIIITTDIKESSISTNCVYKSELTSTIYGIVFGFIALIIVVIIIISVIIYCCVCYKKGGCRQWCRNKCCQCCCKWCETHKDEDVFIEKNMELTIADQNETS